MESAQRSGGRLGHPEAGLTVVEAIMAAFLLAVAVVLTLTPLALAMRVIDRSRSTTVAESLAQAVLEEVRALDYADVGNPGYAPDGVLPRSETRTVDGRDFLVETTVSYAGAATGLDIVDQGGDGVQGIADPGVNYKFVEVVVTPVDGRSPPVRLQTLVAPPGVGALEDVAVVSVLVDRHEPYDPYPARNPTLRIVGPRTYRSATNADRQVFADVAEGAYRVELAIDEGWLLHPTTVADGDDRVTAVAGRQVETVVRVYRPARLTVAVVDTAGSPIGSATVTVTDTVTGITATNDPGELVFEGLVPDPYTVRATAPGYLGGTVDVEVPGPGGGDAATATVVLEEAAAATTVETTFHVVYWNARWKRYYVNGATVTVTHPVLGTWSGTTGPDGNVTLDLPAGAEDFEVTATTPWGHAPARAEFATGTGPKTRTLYLGKPSGTDRYALRGGPVGPRGYYEYRVEERSGRRWRWSSWVRLEVNDQGRATFIVDEEDRRVAIRAWCSPGDLLATRTFTINGRNRSWDPPGRCR